MEMKNFEGNCYTKLPTKRISVSKLELGDYKIDTMIYDDGTIYTYSRSNNGETIFWCNKDFTVLNDKIIIEN